MQLVIILDYNIKRSFLLFYSTGHEVREREREKTTVTLEPEEEFFSAKKEQRRYKEK